MCDAILTPRPLPSSEASDSLSERAADCQAHWHIVLKWGSRPLVFVFCPVLGGPPGEAGSAPCVVQTGMVSPVGGEP